jgi:HK97 family phage prohead protease
MELTLPRPKGSPTLVIARSIPFRAEPNVKLAPGFLIKRFKTLNRKAGTYEAWVSIFGNVDLQGDRVLPNFFDESLKNWVESGDPIPSIYSHQWDNPFAHIGYAEPDAVVPDDLGLHVKEAKVDVDKEFASQVFDLMDQRRIREFSFAYDVEIEEKSKDVAGANDLIKGDLIEFGPTLKGANPDTILAGTKSFRAALDREIEQLEHFAGMVVDGKAKGAIAPPTAPAPETKARVQIAGSIEQSLGAVSRAVTSWAFDTWGYDLFDVYSEATFDDHVIVYVETWDDDWGGGSYWDIPFERADDGTVTLGEAAGVEIEASVVPRKSRTKGRKSGARNSAKDAEWIQTIHDASSELGGLCATVADEDATDSAADDDGEGKSRPSPDGKADELDPETVRLLAETDLLNV